MTTLDQLVVGEQFLFACEVTAIDVNGMALALYGPGAVQAASAVISPAGVMSGNLAAAPDQIPVFVVTGFAPFSVGDVVQGDNGETMVCRWSGIDPEGIAVWSASGDHRVTYTGSGWTKIGTATLLLPRYQCKTEQKKRQCLTGCGWHWGRLRAWLASLSRLSRCCGRAA